MSKYIYSRICQDWKSDDQNKRIEKLGCTQYIQYRKWWGATERLHPSVYKWYIKINNLGQIRSLASAEATIFHHPFFSRRNVNNGSGSGDEFFEFCLYENSLQKACEVLASYDVEFEVYEGDPFEQKPPNLPKEEKIPKEDPHHPIMKPQSEEIIERDYQKECLQNMLNVKKGIIIAATGIGKTVIMSMYIKHVEGRYLVVVPSKKLLYQTIKTFQKILGEPFKVYKYNQYIPDVNNIVVVGLYQSSHKLQHVKNIDCIIFDECHSTVVLNKPNTEEDSRFQKLLSYPCERKFFFTATEKNLITGYDNPISMDNENIYGPVIFRYDLASGIEDGYLCDYIFHLVATNNKITSSIKYIKAGYKTIIFCGLQETVEDVYKRLYERLPYSIKVYKLGENDDIESTTRSYSEYNDQAVIVSCRKITMGYDEPQIDTVIHYDVTTSSIMTHQRNGRVFRPYKDKIMATLVFLCEITDDEAIKNLHKPVAYLKQMDRRLESRIQRERDKNIRGEFSTVNVYVDDVYDVQEHKSIYDRCWNAIDGTQISYRKAKEIIKYSIPRPQSWKEYIELCERDSRLYKNPEEVYTTLFEGRVDYLGLERKNYVGLNEYKTEFSKYDTRELKLSKICKYLQKNKGFPPYDLVIDMYKLNKLNDIVLRKNIDKLSEDDFKMFMK